MMVLNKNGIFWCTQRFSLSQQVLREETTWSPATTTVTVLLAHRSLSHVLVQLGPDEDNWHLGCFPTLRDCPPCSGSESQPFSKEPACLESSGSGQASPSFQAPCCGPGSWAQIISTLPGSWLKEKLSGNFGITPCSTATDSVKLKALALGKSSWWVYPGAVLPGKLSRSIWSWWVYVGAVPLGKLSGWIWKAL